MHTLLLFAIGLSTHVFCPSRGIVVPATGNLTQVFWDQPEVHVVGNVNRTTLQAMTSFGSGGYYPVGTTPVMYSDGNIYCILSVTVLEGELNGIN